MTFCHPTKMTTHWSSKLKVKKGGKVNKRAQTLLRLDELGGLEDALLGELLKVDAADEAGGDEGLLLGGAVLHGLLVALLQDWEIHVEVGHGGVTSAVLVT